MNEKRNIEYDSQEDPVADYITENAYSKGVKDGYSALRSHILWSGWSLADYVWDVIKNIIVIFILFAIYNSIYGSFETVVVSLLVIIYLNVVSYGAVLSQNSMRSMLYTHSQAVETRKQIGEIESPEDEEEFQRATFMLQKTMYKFYINAVFNTLIFFGVLLALFSSL